jgi:hypothetical protein
VAVAHFGLSVFCFVAPFLISTAEAAASRLNASGHQAWIDFISNSRLLLQPQFYFFPSFNGENAGPFFLLLLTIPLWSQCFGWIFVILDNWLNHFPVLGRKIF